MTREIDTEAFDPEYDRAHRVARRLYAAYCRTHPIPKDARYCPWAMLPDWVKDQWLDVARGLVSIQAGRRA